MTSFQNARSRSVCVNIFNSSKAFDTIGCMNKLYTDLRVSRPFQDLLLHVVSQPGQILERQAGELFSGSLRYAPQRRAQPRRGFPSGLRATVVQQLRARNLPARRNR